MTKNKELAQKYAPNSYELTDEPYFGYEIHICKTSCGWLPLFQAHISGIRSVAEYKAAYDTGEFRIFDEYHTEYNWGAFDELVLKFNGGILGVKAPGKNVQDKTARWHDDNMPEYLPVSHIPGSKQSYKYDYDYDDYFTDEEGYEFTEHTFF